MIDTIAIIGAGNMGSSILGGLIQSGFSNDQLWISDPSDEKLESLKKKFDIHTTSNNEEAVDTAEVVLFAVKPQIFKSVAQDLRSTIVKRNCLIISIAAGIPMRSIQKWLAENLAIVRAMPNIPALVNCGMTALYANQHVNLHQKEMAEKILKAVGEIIWMNDENKMNAVTAVSGSGPAYFFLIMEALEKAAQHLGLSSNEAHLLTLQTAFGSASIAKSTSDSFRELRKNVTSPGGTTEKAINVLEKKELSAIFLEALLAAYKRAQQLTDEFGE